MPENYWLRDRVTRRSVLRGAALGGAGLAGAALIGCGGDDEPSGGAPAATGTTAGAGTATPVAKRRGGALRAALVVDPPGWSVFTASTATVQVNSHAYDKLLDIATGPGRSASSTQVIPQIASALPEQPDGQTYVFKIRQGVKFQNVAPVNGRPLVAEDVKYAIDTLRNNGSFKADYAPVTDVTTPDAQTVVVKTSKPYAPLLNFSAGHYGWRIFPKEIIDSKITDTNAIGTGPYIRTAWDQGKQIVFKKNADYWNKETAYVDEIQYLVIPDVNSQAAAFKTKQIDIVGGLSCVQADDLAKQVKDATVQKAPGTAGWISINTTKPPFNDVRVRQALSLLYNREAEAEAIYCGDAATTGILPFDEALKPKDIPDMANYMKYDVKQAKDLLTAAGFKDGFKTTIAWNPQYGATYASALERYVGDLKQGGIDATPVSYEAGVWIRDIYRGEYKFDGLLWGPGRTYSDPDPYVAYWLHPKGIANQSRVNDPALTALVEKQATQINVKERWETLKEIQRLEAKNMYYIWRNAGTTAVFVQKNVHDFARHDAYDSHEYWSAWVDA